MGVDMSQTFEAVIDKDGEVHLLKPIQLAGTRRALVTILDDQPASGTDAEMGYRAMAQDEARESEAVGLAEATIGDVSNEAR
jgi:hypothetical protein